jgi:hypothetical protein
VTYTEWLIRYEALLREIAQASAELLAAIDALENSSTTTARPPVAENPEPDDVGRPPISDPEAYRLQDKIAREVNTLADMGIFATSKWRLEAHCRYHGTQSLTLETNEDIPEGSWLRCFGCLNNGVTRWLEVTERKRLVEEGT